VSDITPAPEIVNRIPVCSAEGCPAYDGKRCSLTGFRPDRICEPSVITMIDQLAAYRELREALIAMTGVIGGMRGGKTRFSQALAKVEEVDPR